MNSLGYPCSRTLRSCAAVNSGARYTDSGGRVERKTDWSADDGPEDRKPIKAENDLSAVTNTKRETRGTHKSLVTVTG